MMLALISTQTGLAKPAKRCKPDTVRQEGCQPISLTRMLSGVHFHLMKLSPKNVATYIRAINANNSVHGIIVYYPIFGDRRDDEIRQLVAPSKDVEGLNHQTLHRISDAAEVSRPPKPGRNVIPCTPRAVAWILEWMDVHDRTRPAGERL